ncbi:MAG: hypothetical protein Q9220_007742 [cf. Caloplaca sp. 1 TL-2023]
MPSSPPRDSASNNGSGQGDRAPLLPPAAQREVDEVPKGRSLFSDWWLWELLATCTSINSVISFLSTISKLCIISAVSAAISQSLLIPLGNLFDPFLQQVVTYPNRLVPSKDIPEIARSNAYAAKSDEGLPLPSVVDLSMKAAIYNGIFDIKDNADAGIAHTCSTGDCTWNHFASLAVCSQCVNITSHVKKECANGKCHRLSLPDGPVLSGLGGQINSSMTRISSDLHRIAPSVLRFSVLVSKEVTDARHAFALECSMFYCVGIYNASIAKGVPKQRMLASWRNDSASIGTQSDLVFHPPDSFDGQFNRTGPFKVTHLAASAINSFMTGIFTGAGGMNSSGSAFSSDVMQALYDTINITARVENLATAMTNSIRGQDDHQSNPAYGTAWSSETYVHVRWAWFAFPAGLLLLSAVFLCGVMIETAQREILVWKASNLALLFHGRNLDLSSPGKRPVTRLSAMTAKARIMKVKLTKTSNLWNLAQDRQ